MKTAHCPSCGAPVVFKSAASVYAVCEFCRSTLLRDGESLENLGRMADLMDDPSLIRIGTEGKYQGVHFGVIGRIQLSYDAGLWNEWYILFDDGRTAWLSEAGGEFVISAPATPSGALPAFESLEPGASLNIGGHTFTVSVLNTARCIAGQGELPFKVASGYDVNTADLRDGQKFATIDYSESPPLLFLGEPVKFDALALSNLNESPAESFSTADAGRRLKVEAFSCPNCAAPLTIHSIAIKSIGCPGCGTLLGVENDKVQQLSKAAQKLRIQPWLPLGSKGRLANVDWETIGFMQRFSRAEGEKYFWREYLLFNAKEGFAWLTEYDGHWNFVRTLSNPPSAPQQSRGPIRYAQTTFKHFSLAQAEVDYVLGEFYWRVRVGETCSVDDFISPPRMLSREVTENEVTWSEGVYTEASLIRQAFGVTAAPLTQRGVYANQPNPWDAVSRKSLRLYGVFLLAATLIQLAFLLSSPSGSVLKENFVLSADNAEPLLTSREFVLKEPARALRLRHQTDIDNNWVGLSSVLVEKQTGAAYRADQEIGYYYGVDDGERWSEGSRSDAIVFRNLPAGTYYLNIEYELGGDVKRADYRVADSVSLTFNPVGWSSYFLLILSLAAFPLQAGLQLSNFETVRWAESDYAEEEDDENDEDDDEDDDE